MASDLVMQPPLVKPRIIFAVTSHLSLRLLGTMPRFFSRSGWEVSIVADSVAEMDAARLVKGVEFHAVKMMRRPDPLRDFVSFIQWLALLRKLRPDVLFVGTPKSSALASFAAWCLRVPVRIYHLRGLRLESSTGLFRVVLTLVELMTTFFSTQVVAVSESLRTEYLRRLLGPGSKVVVLGHGSSHGVDLEPPREILANAAPSIARQLELAKKENRKVVCFAGRFSKDKGSEFFFQLREALFRQGLDHEFLVIGPIEDFHEFLSPPVSWHYRPPLIAGEFDGIHSFLPHVSLLVLPTYREGLPNVILEAAAMSVPSVTTSATGAIDAVIHGLTGLVVPKGDREAFATAVMTLLSSPHLLERMGQNARDHVFNNFADELVNRAHHDFVSDLLAKASGSPVFRT